MEKLVKNNLDERMQKLLNLMEKSKFVPLKRFAFEINNYRIEVKPICFKNVSNYSSLPVTIVEKNNSHVYKTIVKVKNDEEKSIITYKNTYDSITFKEMSLEVNGENCKFISKVGRQKEEYTFSFNDKKILNFVDKNESKEKVL